MASTVRHRSCSGRMGRRQSAEGLRWVHIKQYRCRYRSVGMDDGPAGIARGMSCFHGNAQWTMSL